MRTYFFIHKNNTPEKCPSTAGHRPSAKSATNVYIVIYCNAILEIGSYFNNCRMLIYIVLNSRLFLFPILYAYILIVSLIISASCVHSTGDTKPHAASS